MSARLVLINGSPSAGKTSLLRQILGQVPDPWFHLNLDRHLLGYDRRYWTAAYWDTVVSGYESCLVAMLTAGHDVMCESVLPSGNASRFTSIVKGYRPYVIALRCELAEVHRREGERERPSGGHYYVHADEHAAIQAFNGDLVLDSTHRSVEDLADEAMGSLVANNYRGKTLERVTTDLG